MTPRQARAARAMLGLDMKNVCALADIGKRTLREFEAGARSINSVTESKLKAFYISNGLSFTDDGEYGEGVKYISSADANDEQHNSIKRKIEYADLFEFHEVSRHIKQITDSITAIESMDSISKSIIGDLLARSGLNQKQLSTELGYTGSFVNAIAMGKKRLPVSAAAGAQKFFDPEFIDIERALRQEKIISDLEKKLQALLKEYFAAWRAIYR